MKTSLKACLFALGMAALASPALAAGQVPDPVFQSWAPRARLASPLAVTTTTGNVALPSPGNSARACNRGSVDLYINFGADNTVTATTTTGFLVEAGICHPYNLYPPGATAAWKYVAAITASGSSTLYIETGDGSAISMNAASGAVPSGPAGGDLSGTYPNPTVVSFNGGTLFGTAAGKNTGTSGANVPLLSTANSWALPQALTQVSVQPGTFTVPGGSSLSPTGSVFYNYAAEVNGTSACATRCPTNGFYIAKYDVNNTAGGFGNNLVAYTNLGGTNQVGGFLNMDSFLNINATTGNSATSAYYQAGNFYATAGVNDNGTSLAPRGNLFGGGAYSYLTPGATYWAEAITWEDDLAIAAGASATSAGGHSVVLLSTNATTPTRNDEWGFTIGAQAGATPTMVCGYCLGNYDSISPFAADASIMAYQLHAGSGSGPTLANGIHFNGTGAYGAITFTGCAYDSTGFCVNGAGNVAATSVNKMAITAPASSSTLSVADGKTLTASNTMTLACTDGCNVAFGAGGTPLYANQTITLTGDVTGSGTTSIVTTSPKYTKAAFAAVAMNSFGGL